MKPLQQRLRLLREEWRVGWEVLERDSLLSYLLAAVQAVPALHEHLVVKGGGCLRKCYGHSRFSEDLDFSARQGAPTGPELDQAFAEAVGWAQAQLQEFAPIRLRWERYRERRPHPEGQESYQVMAQLPWHRDFHTRVLVEISRAERILWAPLVLSVKHHYGEPLVAQANSYARQEIVAEKLRALLQQARRLEERGWTRSRARDYYDCGRS